MCNIFNPPHLRGAQETDWEALFLLCHRKSFIILWIISSYLFIIYTVFRTWTKIENRKVFMTTTLTGKVRCLCLHLATTVQILTRAASKFCSARSIIPKKALRYQTGWLSTWILWIIPGLAEGQKAIALSKFNVRPVNLLQCWICLIMEERCEMSKMNSAVLSVYGEHRSPLKGHQAKCPCLCKE